VKREKSKNSRRKGGHGGANSVNMWYLVPQFLWIESIFAWHRCVNEVDRLVVPALNINLQASIATTMTMKLEGSRPKPPVCVLTRVCRPYTCRQRHIVVYAPLNTNPVWRLSLYEVFFDLRVGSAFFVVSYPCYCRYNPFSVPTLRAAWSSFS